MQEFATKFALGGQTGGKNTPVSIIKRKLHVGAKMNFILSAKKKQYFTYSLGLFVKY